MLAIDPGEKHCGLAYFEDDATDWHVVTAYELPPEACFAEVAGFIRDELDVLIVEAFRLYPWKSEAQSFSQLRTVEVIGVLRYLHARALENGADVEWVEQGADIKKPAAAICNAKGITALPKSNRHVKDAQLHGWYWILRKEGEIDGK